MGAAKLMCSLLQRTKALTWSRLKREMRCLHAGTVYTSTTEQKKHNQWGTPFKLKEPEYDLDYILNPRNHRIIRENIRDRKGVGNIELVVDLHQRLESTIPVDAMERENITRDFLVAAAEIPNSTHPQSPIGDEEEAILVDLVGTKLETSSDQPTLQSMAELGDSLGLLRTSHVNLTTGHMTYYLLGQLAMLEQALVSYTVDYLLQMGFQLVSVPDLLHPGIIESCGFKTTGDVAQVYRLDTERHPDLCLAGTSEMPLAGYFIDDILKMEDLPMKVAAVSRCYRAETSHMEEEYGIYRVHQFTKVEMFVVSSNNGDEGNHLLMELIEIQKTLFSQLGLHFRVLDMPTAELGAPAHRKFDIEAWMPAKQFWGEISSASNCTDYQSRRLNIKYKSESEKPRHCSTVNGTACAVPRTIMAVCETHQNQDGSINIPEVLQGYMDGLPLITKPECLPRLSWNKSNKLKR